MKGMWRVLLIGAALCWVACDTAVEDPPSAYTHADVTPDAVSCATPNGFAFVPRGTVEGSEAYRTVFTYPSGASFGGEEGVQYGAFVEGRTVEISAFYMAKYEVTWEEWDMVKTWATDEARGDKKYIFANKGLDSGGNRPVTGISWRDAIVWCNAYTEWHNANAGTEELEPVYYRYGGEQVLRSASGTAASAAADNALMKREKNGYRLPTMAEREYAARGADPSLPDWSFLYAGSDNPDEVAWYYGTSGSGLPGAPDHSDYGMHPVGTKAPNRLYIYDLSGNVMEWGWDWMHFTRNGNNPPMGSGTAARLDPATPPEGPARSSDFSQKPMLGGNWHASSPYALNTMWWGFTPDYQDNKVGFRVVRSW